MRDLWVILVELFRVGYCRFGVLGGRVRLRFLFGSYLFIVGFVLVYIGLVNFVKVKKEES